MHAHHTEVIASRSELLSLHCPRHLLLLALLPACADSQVIMRQETSAYAEEPLRTVGLLDRGSSSVQFARRVQVCKHSRPTCAPYSGVTVEEPKLTLSACSCHSLGESATHSTDIWIGTGGNRGVAANFLSLIHI